MCGRENEFAREQLTRDDVDEWGTESETVFVGHCVDCGEAIRFTPGNEQAGPHRARRWEVWAAFVLLAGIGGWLVYSLLTM